MQGASVENTKLQEMVPLCNHSLWNHDVIIMLYLFLTVAALKMDVNNEARFHDFKISRFYLHFFSIVK